MDRIAIDVGEVLQGSVASLYSPLVTRPTGRAVRMAIETQLQGAGRRSLSLIDFSEVVIIDFSCADEVVAKLLQKYGGDDVHEAFFVFRGVHEPHRDQIEVVLARHGLAAVAETGPGSFEIVGSHSEPEGRVWTLVEEHGMVAADRVQEVFPHEDDRAALASLSERRLAFTSPASGSVHALSRLIAHLL